TSHSYMGQDRFDRLMAMLPPDVDVFGIDEHTAALLDFASGSVRVLGRGGVTWLQGERSVRVEPGGSVSLAELGLSALPPPLEGIPATLWEMLERASDESNAVP